MTTRNGLVVSLCVALLAAAGCGSDGKGAGRPGDDAGAAPSSRGAPVEDTGEAEAYAEAEAAFEAEDFDTAIPAMEALGGYRDAKERALEFRRAGAKALIRSARRKIKNGPQASVSQLKTSLKYFPTAEARALLVRAEKALVKFKAKECAAGRGACGP